MQSRIDNDKYMHTTRHAYRHKETLIPTRHMDMHNYTEQIAIDNIEQTNVVLHQSNLQ